MASESGTSMTDSEIRAAYEARIDALFAGAPAAKFSGVTVLEHSDVLDMLGFEDKPVRLAENYVYTSTGKHLAMTSQEWKKIPDWMENPALIFDSDTESGRLVFIAPDLVNSNPVRIIVSPNGELAAHIVVNAYDSHRGTTFMRWAQDGLLRYADTKKAPQVDERFGRQLPDILKNPYFHPSSQIHRMGRGKQKLAERTRILTEKNLEGYRKNRLLSGKRQSTQPSLIDLQGLCPREAAKKLFAHTQGDLKHWALMAASAQAAGLVIDRKALEAVQGKPALTVQEAMLKSVKTVRSQPNQQPPVKDKENTR